MPTRWQWSLQAGRLSERCAVWNTLMMTTPHPNRGDEVPRCLKCQTRQMLHRHPP